MQYRRNDLRSLGCMLLYFLRGSIPRQSLEATSQRQKEELILAKKETLSTKNLCEGLPAEFGTYIDHVRSGGFAGILNRVHETNLTGLLCSREILRLSGAL